MKRLLESRALIAVLCTVLGASVAGGVAFAASTSGSSSDKYYACVGIAGHVRPTTIRLNTPPASCPNKSDQIHSWNAQGPVGPPGSTSVAALTVSPGAGGVVQGNGIDCASSGALSDCTEVYPIGTTVVLHAGPNSNLTFGGWGGACSGTGDCTLVMTADKLVTATFATVTLTKSGALVVDSNGNGTVSPGDTLQYTLTMKNTSASAVGNQVINDAVGTANGVEVRSAALVAGTVTTTAGTVTTGNAAGDTDVVVTVPSVPANGTVTVRFRAVAHPIGGNVRGLVFGPFVLNTATVGQATAVDPNPPSSGPCTQLNFGAVCINADAVETTT
jgi:uncharacterized repeat protein (TIGR01451 family)